MMRLFEGRAQIGPVTVLLAEYRDRPPPSGACNHLDQGKEIAVMTPEKWVSREYSISQLATSPICEAAIFHRNDPGLSVSEKASYLS